MLIQPEVKLARRLLHRRGLTPPVDVQTILSEYASIEFVRFPIEIDGLCLDLKVIGKRPRVLAEINSPRNRKRFTLAHELGHVLIPWHYGTILDHIDVDDLAAGEYFELESEANRFASELLLPHEWVSNEVNRHTNPIRALFHVAKVAQVSLSAASIKVTATLPPHYSIACSRNHVAIWSARSGGTLAAAVVIGTDLTTTNPYPFPCKSWVEQAGAFAWHAWHFTPITLVQSANVRPWREVLDEIVLEIISDNEVRAKFKASVSGVASAANGSVRTERQPEAVAAAIVQRLYARAASDSQFRNFVNHRSFREFYNARARAFFA